MLDGKTFLPVTGTPIRKMACISRLLADADPVPVAVAILKAKSLTRSMSLFSHEDHEGDRRTRRKQIVHFVAFDLVEPSWFDLFVPSWLHTATVAGTTASACGISTANLRISHA